MSLVWLNRITVLCAKTEMSPQCPPGQAWRWGCLPLIRWGGSAGPASLMPPHSPPEESATQHTQIRQTDKITPLNKTTHLFWRGELFWQTKLLLHFTDFTNRNKRVKAFATRLIQCMPSAVLRVIPLTGTRGRHYALHCSCHKHFQWLQVGWQIKTV